MRECRAAVTLQGAKHRISIDLIAGAIQITSAIVTTDVIAVRHDSIKAITDDAMASGADVKDRIFEIGAAIPNLHVVIAQRAINYS